MNEPVGHRPVEEVRVLLIEDDPLDARTVRNMLGEARGAMAVQRGMFTVTWTDCLAAALGLLRPDRFSVVLMDMRLPDSAGLKTLAEVRAAAPDVPIIVLTGFDDDGLALHAIQQGAQDYLTKDDLEAPLLVRTIRHAIERKRAEVQLLRHASAVEAAHAEIERQAAELRQRAEQLDRINHELDDFTYVASHDLKEPLRGIRAYCEILLEDYRDRLDEAGSQRLTKLVELCQRLETLISDLLTYCRVGGVRPAAAHVDLGEVVDEVLETLCPTIDGRGALVQVQGRLPTVTGDPTLIALALANLISNGLKFIQSPRPQVEIGCLPTDPPTIYVRDNGIGIPKEHQQAIFTIFRRLHGRHQYEGSGVGLTIVRKIIQAHGGQIWLDSQPGEGSTFYVTLAAPPEKPAGDAGPRAPHWVGTAASPKLNAECGMRNEE